MKAANQTLADLRGTCERGITLETRSRLGYSPLEKGLSPTTLSSLGWSSWLQACVVSKGDPLASLD